MTALVQPHYDVPADDHSHSPPAPLAIPALGFVIGIVAARMGVPTTLPVSLELAAFAVLVAARSVRNGASGRVLVCLAFIAAIVGAARYQAALVLPPDDISHGLSEKDQLCRIRGLVVTPIRVRTPEIRNVYIPSRPSPRIDFVLEARSTAGPAVRPLTGLVRVFVDGETLRIAPGDEVEVTGWISRIRGPQNPGEADWEAIAARNGIRANLSADSAAHVRSLAAVDAATRRLAETRAWVRARLLESLPAESESASRLLDTLVLGQRSAVERSVDDAFKRVGAVHFLSVSGFHVGVLAFAVIWVTRKLLRCGPRISAIATAIALIAYGLLAEPNSPIIRAVLVGVLASVGILIRRRMAFLNWLSLALIIVLAWNPLEMFSAGFQLSFLLACSLLTFVALLERSIRRIGRGDVPSDADTRLGACARTIGRWLRGLFLVNLCCWLLAAPLVMHHFGMFTPLSAIQSIALTPIVVVITLFGFVTLIAGAVWPAAGLLLGEPLAMMTDGLNALVDWLSRMPGTVIECMPPPAWFVWVNYCAFAVAVFLWTRPAVVRRMVRRGRRIRRARAVAVALSLALILAWIGWAALPFSRPHGLQLDVLAVGNGSAALLTTREGRAAVLDCGSMQNIDAGAILAATARLEGVRALDLVAISHANFDHFSGAPALLERYPAARLASHPSFARDSARSVATRRFLQASGSQPLTALSAGDEVALGACRLTVLWPPAAPGDRWDENDRSVVVRIEYAGRRILAPGDASQLALAELSRLHEAGEIDLAADVLIAPHHGAVVGASAAFYRAVAPRWVVVSALRRRDPIEGLILREVGPTTGILVTGEDGGVRIAIDPGGVVRVSRAVSSD